MTIGVYPRHVRSREEENVFALMEGVSTAVNVEGDDDRSGESDGDDDGDEDDGGLVGIFE